MKKTILYLFSTLTLLLSLCPLAAQADEVIVNRYIELCEGETFLFRGQEITQTGVYYDTLFAPDGKDSIFMMVVNRAASYHFEDSISLGDNQTFVWHGHIVDHTDTYYDEYRTQSGCDSSYVLHATVYPTYHYIEQQTVCENALPYQWQGHTYSHGGVYTRAFHTIYGHDSIYELHLQVLPVARITEYRDLCRGSVLQLRGRTITEPGMYTDTLISTLGCDSIVNTVVNYARSYFYEQYGYIAQGGTYDWNGRILHEAGVYWDSAFTTEGCDSIQKLVLTYKPTYEIPEAVTICESELPYLWRGRTFYSAGKYCDSLFTQNGVDSIYSLLLTVRPAILKRSMEDFCESDGFYFKGKRYTTSTVLYDTLVSSLGCDSIVMHVLNAHPNYLFETTAYLHKDSTYTWRGKTYDTAGVYYENHQTQGYGCDSIYRLNLIDKTTHYFLDSAIVCENELPYLWHGQLLYKGGSYTDKLYTEEGADSIYEFSLRVLSTEYEYETVTICRGEEFFFHGEDRSQSGIYTDTLLTDSGCWRIHQMQVNVLPTYLFEETQYIQPGETYTWQGKTYSTPGVYEMKATTILGCDSIHRLTLVERASYHFMEFDTVCESQLPYMWHGKPYTESGTYYASYINQEGGDSLYTLQLEVKKPTYNTMYVNLCKDETYLFGGRVINKSGVYTDTLVNIEGCDSILTLIVNDLPSYHIEHHVTLPPGGKYTWQQHEYTLPGTYPLYFQTAAGCDSVLVLVVHEKEVYFIDSTVTVCQSELPYVFRGKQYFHAGEFYDSISTTITTDTVARLHLNVLPSYLKEMAVDLCEGQTYHFHGRNLSEPGIYYDSLLSSHGCDSVYRIVVNRMPSYRYHETHRMGDNETYLWHGQTITKSGTYYDKQHAVSGCDSIYTLEVTVFPTYHYEENVTLCPSELPYHFQGADYDLSGTYEKPFHTVDGFDSIYTLNLTVLPTYHSYQYLELCEGESYLFRDHPVTTAGVYHDTLRTHMGCDSIFTLVVNRSSNYLTQRYVELCEGDEYPFRGGFVTEAGTYFDTLQTRNGCDSIIKLVVNRASSYIQVDYHELCEGATFIFRGRTITEPGVYYDSLLTVHGCDSIFKMVVNRAASYHFEDSIKLPDNQPILWHGQTVDKTGTYYDSHLTTSGCDSTYVLHAEVFPTYRYESSLTICESELPYLWEGQSLSHEGAYTQAYHTVQGYDSIYVLHLTVLPTYRTHVNLQLCEGHELTYNGRTITKAGVYNDTLKTIMGCDSIIEVVVNLNKAYHLVETISIPDNGSTNWRGQTYTQAGTYYERYTTVQGCDSIFELNLRVYPTYDFRTERTICESELPYTFNGQTYTHAGEYTAAYKTVHGFDSTETFVLNVLPAYHKTEYRDLCKGSVLTLRGRSITEPGVYSDTLRSSLGCDSVVTTIVNYARSYFHEQYAEMKEGSTYVWRGRILSESGVYWDSLFTIHGCDSISKLVLSYKKAYEIPDSVVVCESELPYLWHGREFYADGRYYDSLFTAGGMDSIHTLRLVVLPTQYQEKMVELCEGDSVLIRGHYYKRPTIVMDTMLTASGCYNITKYVITAHPSYRIEREAYMNRGGAYYWHKDAYEDRPERVVTLTEAGVYYDSLKTIHGCDSVFKLTLRYNPTYHFQEDETVCEQDLPFVWRGQSLYKSNTYHDTLKTVAGVDSIYTLNLMVYDSAYVYHEVTLCQGETYTYKNHTFYTEGTYRDSLLTIHGCDSIIQVTVNYRPAYQVEEKAFFCENGTYIWEGHIDPVTQSDYVFNRPGTYYDRHTSVYGCDSTTILRLERAPQFYESMKDTVCQSDLPYIWRGHEYTQSDHYTDKYISIYGCDSIYALDLLVVPSYLQDFSIDICRGDSYMLNGREITEAGVYVDSLVSVHGCDSVMRYSVNYLRTHFMLTEKAICEGETYNWRGQAVSLPGMYYDSLQTINSCDSVFALRLTVNPVFNEHTYDTICSSSLPYVWRDERYDAAGTYSDTLRSSLGCDSIYTLHLTVRPSYEFVDYIERCAGDTLIFRGDTLTASRVYTDTLYTHDGCDSVRKVVINFAPSYLFKETVRRCSDDNYLWHGQTLHAPGIYFDRHTTVSGCDSVYMINYVTDSATHDGLNVVICRDSLPYVWRGREFWVDTVCTDSYISAAGCDSIFELNLTILDECAPLDTFYMCPGGSVWVHNEEYTQTGQYAIYLASEHQTENYPDSIYRFQILTAPTYYHRDTDLICQNELPYIYNNLVLYEAGTYFDTLPTQYGCDSVFELHLGVRSAAYQELMVEICEGEHFFFRGKEYTTPGVFYDTMFTIGGCDSVFHIVLNRAASYQFEDKRTINEGSAYLFHRDGEPRWLTAPGVYWDSCRTVSGCDSIYRLELTVNKTYHFVEEKTFCADSDSLPYLWRGQTLYESGTYYDKLTTAIGLDSIFELRLTIHEVPMTTIERTYCESDIVTIGGQTITENGIYYHTFTTQWGCDSVVKYVLNFKPAYRVVRNVSIVEGSYYYFPNNDSGVDTLRTPGTYLQTLKSIDLCDSVFELHLHVGYNYRIERDTTICHADLPFVDPIDGKKYYQSGDYAHYFRSSDGFDSIYVFKVNVLPEVPIKVVNSYLCEGDILYLNMSGGTREITEGGIYFDTLHTVLGCDSVIRHVVHKSQNYHFVEEEVINEGSSYTWAKHWGADGNLRTFYKDGTYFDSLRTVGGCDSIYELHLRFKHTYLQEYHYATCFEDPFVDPIDGKKHYHSEDIVHPYTTALGEDSIIIYHLTVWPEVPDTSFVNVYLCEGDELYLPFKDTTYTTHDGDVFTDTMHTIHGCDSVVHYIVHKSQTFHIVQTVTMCEHSSYTWPKHWGPNGELRTFQKSGTYFDSLLTVTGCDSIFELRLKLKDSYIRDTTVLICRDELADRPRDFRGDLLDFSLSDTIEMHDKRIASTGCDSITRYTYLLTDHCSTPEKLDYCDNELILICGETITREGVYRFPTWGIRDSLDADGHVVKTEVHYDSVYRAVVYIHPTYHYTDTYTICHDDTISYHGKYYHQPGTYRIEYKTIYDCDSIYELHLGHYPITPDNHSGILDTIPDYGSVLWATEGLTIHGNALQPDTLHHFVRYHTDANGCSYYNDAYVYVVKTTKHPHQESICYTDLPYTYHPGKPAATEAGQYTVTIFEKAVPISEIHTYDIHVDYPITNITVQTGDVCADQNFGTFNASSVPVVVSYDGGVPSSYEVTFNQMGYNQGLQDQDGTFNAQTNTIDIELPAGSMPIDADQSRPSQLVQPGVYDFQLKLFNGACGAQSQVSSSFTVKYPSWFIEQHFQGHQGAVAVLSPEYNGGHQFTSYRWYINGQLQDLPLNTPYLYSENWAPGVEVYAEFTEQSSGQAIATCPITIQTQPVPNGRPKFVITSRHTGAIQAAMSGTYRLFGANGLLYREGHFEDGETIVEMPDAGGCYILDMTDEHGYTTTEKIILY